MVCQVDINVQVEADTAPSDDEVHRWVAAAVADRRAQSEVSVSIVDAETSQRLNGQYRGRDYPTNVLSFPADLPEELGLPLLGDLVVCAAVVEREAREQGKPPQAHWAHMLVHGTLHLLGYDHIEDCEAEQMEALETTIITGLGFAPPYEVSTTAASDEIIFKQESSTP
ncbi:rRNA maturation RNase YbeY [Gilvimarinus agarilyticus]|uniref:rRNA maturation RNase YbeY n=1 Tax=unclassified Gilvimarinus TaxID=2642066 RepID=UPI001C088069|nr:MULTISPECIES: rRNA maturation RNase YbeY [unclassified Gilvimarinus]MBU2884638.1 rRNA maturation RNase YbeY [Gilvimarinus agarilyticus]MDO6569745.1 rRNA maturation RNase YbeY [Gilvimarinus sp. 2_MG-2023]MDO6747441.1 rRNA maturation RNase YbeY [Gilvimarinus sp. 1_MG-2023]